MKKEVRRPKVYVINRGAHDYSDAERYGDLVYLTEGLLKNPFNTASFYRYAADAMHDAYDGDYILVTSLNSMCTVAGWIIGRLGFSLRLLLFKNDNYIVRTVDENGLLNLEEKQ